MKAVVIGAGPAGLGAAYCLKNKGYDVVVFDERCSIGGLCGSFSLHGFTFDRFIHVSFAKDKNTLKLYNRSCNQKEFKPIIYNRFKDIWIAHPAQYNLYKLSLMDRLSILYSYLLRKKYTVKDYKSWLYRSYGTQFADLFSIPYTDLYWKVDASFLETKWLKGRMYDLSIKDLIKGCFKNTDDCLFYASLFSYPEKGGFASYYNYFKEQLNIKFKTRVINLNYNEKFVMLSNGEKIYYDKIVSTVPLKEIKNIIDIKEPCILSAIDKLNHTSGYIISVGLKKDPSYNNSLFFYNYNKDILSARVYFPHKKSENNCPKGYFSMQIEIYTLNGEKIDTTSDIFIKTINEIFYYCNIEQKDVLFKDIQFEKYANIIFDKDIYSNRKVILDFLKKKNIASIGRFGSWDYLWSFQSLEMGLNIN